MYVSTLLTISAKALGFLVVVEHCHVGKTPFASYVYKPTGWGHDVELCVNNTPPQ